MDEFLLKHWKILGAIFFLFANLIITLITLVVVIVSSNRYSKLERKFERKFAWLKIKMVSMDAALEHSLKNGYANKREIVKESLLDDEEFLNDNDADSQKLEVTIFKKQ